MCVDFVATVKGWGQRDADVLNALHICTNLDAESGKKLTGNGTSRHTGYRLSC